jgi:hypothetical protein
LPCALPIAAPVQEPGAAAVTQDADSFEELSSEFDAAYGAWMERYRAAATDTQRDELIAETPQVAFAPRFLALAERQRGSQEAFQALAWIHRFTQDRAAKLRALALLERDHSESDALAKFCADLYMIEPQAEAFLAQLVETSPHHAVRGQALHARGQLFMRRVGLAQRLVDANEEQLANYREMYGDATIDAVRAAGLAALRSDAEKDFERVAAEYGDLESWRGSLKVSAERNLFELRRLAVGLIAPDIAGEDIEGVAFKLGDYRGKVVVLDFWGHW